MENILEKILEKHSEHKCSKRVHSFLKQTFDRHSTSSIVAPATRMTFFDFEKYLHTRKLYGLASDIHFIRQDFLVFNFFSSSILPFLQLAAKPKPGILIVIH